VQLKQGPGNIQVVNITNNPGYDSAVAGLLDVIRESRLDNDDINELRDEVAKLNRLAISEAKPGLLEKAKARIDYIKIGLAGTDALIKASPHLLDIWEFLSHKLRVK